MKWFLLISALFFIGVQGNVEEKAPNGIEHDAVSAAATSTEEATKQCKKALPHLDYEGNVTASLRSSNKPCFIWCEARLETRREHPGYEVVNLHFISQLVPVKDTTPCGEGKICVHGRCVIAATSSEIKRCQDALQENEVVAMPGTTYHVCQIFCSKPKDNEDVKDQKWVSWFYFAKVVQRDDDIPCMSYAYMVEGKCKSGRCMTSPLLSMLHTNGKTLNKT